MNPSPQPAASPREQKFTLLAVSFVIAVIGYNTTAISTALLAIKNDLHLSAEALLWAVSGYLLTAAVLIILGGESGDLFGHRRMFAVGAGIFALGSILIASAATPAMVLGGRILQGVAAAILMPGGITILELTFPPERRAFALGVWGGVAGLAFGMGPVVGGLFTHYLSWRWIFWINLPVLAAVLFLLLVVLSKDTRLPEKSIRVDFAGLLLVTLTLGPFIFAVSHVPVWGFASPRTLGLLGLAVASGIALVFVEKTRTTPLIQFRLFRSKQFLAGACGTFVVLCVLFTFLYFFNLYVQSPAAFAYSAATAGLVLLPLNLCLFLASLSASRIALRFGYRWPVTIAMLAMAGGLFLLSRLHAGESFLELVPGLALLGAGLGFAFSSCPHIALKAVPPEIEGQGSGLVTMFNYTGGSLGIAIGSLAHHMATVDSLHHALSPLGVSSADQSTLIQRVLHGTTATFASSLDAAAPALRNSLQLTLQKASSDGFEAVALFLSATTLLGAAVSLLLLRGDAVRQSAEHPHRRHHGY